MDNSLPSQGPAAGQNESDVAGLFALDQIAGDIWRSRNCDSRGGRMYGGTLAAQVLGAARETVTATFSASNIDVRYIKPADGAEPVDYHVEIVDDGKSSAVRRVTAYQREAVIAIGSVGFHAARKGWSHGAQTEADCPDDLPLTGTPHRSRAVTSANFDIRYYDVANSEPLTRKLWFRTTQGQPPSVQVHECALVYVSDIYFFEPICLEHGYAGNNRQLRYATTQHSIWFHQPPRVDEWSVLQSYSPACAGGRGLVQGVVRTLGGQPVATVVQEAVCWAAESQTGGSG